MDSYAKLDFTHNYKGECYRLGRYELSIDDCKITIEYYFRDIIESKSKEKHVGTYKIPISKLSKIKSTSSTFCNGKYKVEYLTFSVYNSQKLITFTNKSNNEISFKDEFTLAFEKINIAQRLENAFNLISKKCGGYKKEKF